MQEHRRAAQLGLRHPRSESMLLLDGKELVDQNERNAAVAGLVAGVQRSEQWHEDHRADSDPFAGENPDELEIGLTLSND